MKRDPRLRDLSDDHHQALILARRAARAGEADDRGETRSAWEEVARAYEQELAPHFAIEEELLLPALEALGEVALADRTRADHRRLHELVYGAGERSAKRLAEFGAGLRDHVRFEERELFPICQERIEGGALEAVAAACALARSHSDDAV